MVMVSCLLGIDLILLELTLSDFWKIFGNVGFSSGGPGRGDGTDGCGFLRLMLVGQ